MVVGGDELVPAVVTPGACPVAQVPQKVTYPWVKPGSAGSA